MRVIGRGLLIAGLAIGLSAGRFAAAQSPVQAESGARLSGESEELLRTQARLWLDADGWRREAKLDRWRDAVVKLSDEEQALFGSPTHASLYLAEELAHACDRLKLPAKAREARENAVALQALFLGERPAGIKGSEVAVAYRAALLTQAQEIRAQVLGKTHPAAGLTLIDVALAQEAQGDTDAARTSLQRALAIVGDNRPQFSWLTHSQDARYQLERIELAARPAVDADAFLQQLPANFAATLAAADREYAAADAAEAHGDLAQARAIWTRGIGGFQAAGGPFYACSESVQLAMIRRRHTVVDRFLSFAARNGLSDQFAASMYWGLSNFKGAIYTHLRRTRLERHNPYLKPFFDADGRLKRALAAALVSGGDAQRKPETLWPLVVRSTALEAEIGRRHGELPAELNAPLATLLPADAALVDYWVFQYSPLPDAKPPDTRPAELRLAAFVCRPKAAEVYFDLGPLAPITSAAVRWRRALQKQVAPAGDRGLVFAAEPAATDADPANSDPPEVTLRKRIWQPVEPHLGRANLVLVAPDGVLATLPLAALPGSKPGTFLLEERPLALAPVPRLLKPLASTTGMLTRQTGGDDGGQFTLAEPSGPAGGALLVGNVDFDAPPAELAGQPLGAPGVVARPRGGRPVFPPLPGTKVEVQQIGDLFKQSFSKQQLHLLTGAGASTGAFCATAADQRWIHLATHAYFAAGSGQTGADALELRSAIVLAGASSTAPSADGVGLLTALEVASLDLDRTDLAVLSACETGLGTIQEGEGVQGLQRAFQVAGAKTVVATLWQIDDAASQTLMRSFYENLWQKKLTRLEALRQAQLKMLREGPAQQAASTSGDPGKSPTRTPPFYWAPFVLSGDWRAIDAAN